MKIIKKKKINKFNINYNKKIIYPSTEEVKLHKEFLKLNLKKNYFS